MAEQYAFGDDDLDLDIAQEPDIASSFGGTKNDATVPYYTAWERETFGEGWEPTHKESMIAKLPPPKNENPPTLRPREGLGFKKACYIESMMLHVRLPVAEQPCDHCIRLRGKFTTCVPGPKEWEFIQGACTNCHYQANASSCSFRSMYLSIERGSKSKC
jgi:hypothetical protein